MTDARKDTRRYLSVRFAERAQAKKIGAQWDPDAKLWWVPLSVPLGMLSRKWLMTEEARKAYDLSKGSADAVMKRMLERVAVPKQSTKAGRDGNAKPTNRRHQRKMAKKQRRAEEEQRAHDLALIRTQPF